MARQVTAHVLKRLDANAVGLELVLEPAELVGEPRRGGDRAAREPDGVEGAHAGTARVSGLDFVSSARVAASSGLRSIQLRTLKSFGRNLHWRRKSLKSDSAAMLDSSRSVPR